MKSSVIWDVTLCSPLKINQRFGGTCRLHLQARIISQTINQRDGDSKKNQNQSQSYVTTDGQSASLSWNEAPM
jgi:hypothetical protein